MNFNIRNKFVLKKAVVFFTVLFITMILNIHQVYAYGEKESSINLRKYLSYSKVNLINNNAIIISSSKNNISPKFTQEEIILDRNLKGTVLFIISSQLTVVLVILNTVRKVKKQNKYKGKWLKF